MVRNATLISMFVPIIFSFLLFIGLILFFRKRIAIQKKPLILGAVGFFFFTQILEKIMHIIVLSQFTSLMKHPIGFGLYGGFAAGIFEEIGRFILYSWLLKKFRDYQSGISFGIGWGGIEAVLITLMVIVPNIVFAFMINNGTFDSTLGAKMQASTLHVLKKGVLEHGASYYLLACVERFFSIFLQIFLSILVLYGVAKKKFQYVILSILIHASVDFVASFYQSGLVKQLWSIELFTAVVGVISMIMIHKSRKWFLM